MLRKQPLCASFIVRIGALSPFTSRYTPLGPTKSPCLCSLNDDNESFSINSNLNEDWRSFRARLVRREADEDSISALGSFLSEQHQQELTDATPSDTSSSSSGTWAHPVSFIEAGSLLLSSPRHFKGDRNITFFSNTAILILQHTRDQGSIGVILNRPVSVGGLGNISGGRSTDVDPVLQKLFSHDNCPVFLGGPVSLETLSVLHSDQAFGNTLTGCIRSAGCQAAVDCFQNGTLPSARFFLGYTGWHPGQLQAEIDQGVWICCSCSDDLLLRRWKSGTQLHKIILPLMGGVYSEMVSVIPPDPSDSDSGDNITDTTPHPP